ncbi:MAG: hypothetical protein U0165_14850 [Polyangiaceae bacterium]
MRISCSLVLAALVSMVIPGCGGDDDDAAQQQSACKTDDPTTCPKGNVCEAQASGNACVPGCSRDYADSCDTGLVCEEIQGAKPQCFAPVEIRGKVVDALSTDAIEAARVAARDDTGAIAQKIAVSAKDGTYTLSISTPRNDDGSPVKSSVTLRGDASKYASFPSGLRPALPVDLSTATASTDAAPAGDHGGKVWVIENPLTTLALLPLPDSTGLGTLKGKVDAENAGGTLVTAGSSTGIADVDGEFVVFNVPAGPATVHGYAANLQLTPVDVTVKADAEVKDIVLSPASTALATVSGGVNLVNAGGLSSTSVVLVVEETFIEALEVGEVPKGLRADNVTNSFSISGVPEGKYVVLASLDNDGLVRDPDTSIAGTDIVHIEVKNGAAQSGLSFKVTGALAVVSPGADGPEEVTGNPTFTWADDSSEDGYEVVVFDAFGNKIWEDLAVPSVKGNKNVEMTYSGPALDIGMYYQFRATSMKSGVPISRTEQLRGVFIAKLYSAHRARRENSSQSRRFCFQWSL